MFNALAILAAAAAAVSVQASCALPPASCPPVLTNPSCEQLHMYAQAKEQVAKFDAAMQTSMLCFLSFADRI